MGKKESHATDHPVLRVLFLCGGLTVMAFGVACSVKAGLGTSPISSVPYVTSRISGLSVGATTVVMNVLFILIQIAILRKAYDRFQLLQLPATLLFGAMIDAAGYLLQTVSCVGYVWQWLMCAAGIVLVALGVSMEVMAGLIATAGEGIVLAITRVAPREVQHDEGRARCDVGRGRRAALVSVSRASRRCPGGHRGGGGLCRPCDPADQSADGAGGDPLSEALRPCRSAAAKRAHTPRMARDPSSLPYASP